MNCKYCHLNTHFIDNCPTIICKICKDIGHPQWLCNKKNYNKNIDKRNKVENKIENKIEKKIENKIEKKIENKILNKNINYYLLLEKQKWGDII